MARRRSLLVASAVVACCSVLGPSSAAHGAMGAMPPPRAVSAVTFRPLPRPADCEQRLARAAGNGKLAIVSGDPGAGYVRAGVERAGPVAAGIARIGLRALRPTLVIVQAGHDDIGVPPDLERSRVEQAITLIRAEAPQARIALVTVFTGRSPSAAAYRTDRAIVAGAMAADSQVIVIDPLAAGWRFPRVHDGLHPTAGGSAWIAGQVARILREHGVRQGPPGTSVIVCDQAVRAPGPRYLSRR